MTRKEKFKQWISTCIEIKGGCTIDVIKEFIDDKDLFFVTEKGEYLPGEQNFVLVKLLKNLDGILLIQVWE